MCICLVSCFEEEECNGFTRCDGNRILICQSAKAIDPPRWNEFRNCDDYDATCQPLYTKYADPINPSSPIEKVSATRHSCVIDTYDCTTVGYFCTEDNQYTVSCSTEHSTSNLTAAVAEYNWEGRPYCVHTRRDTVFAWAEGSCANNYETYCDDDGRKLICLRYSWQWQGEFCPQ